MSKRSRASIERELFQAGNDLALISAHVAKFPGVDAQSRRYATAKVKKAETRVNLLQAELRSLPSGEE